MFSPLYRLREALAAFAASDQRQGRIPYGYILAILLILVAILFIFALSGG